MTFTASARRLGIVSALGTVLAGVAYVPVLIIGFFSLASSRNAMGDPVFAILEILIVVSMPLMIGLMVAVHAWAPADSKVFSLIALVFVSLLAGLTMSVHFVLLTVGRQAMFTGQAWMPLFVSFTWPSVAYALDVLAWDVFFALSALFAAPVFTGTRLARSIRMLLLVSGTLALAGTSGAFVGNMQLRNIGIAGYAGVFPIAALMLAILFHRTPPREVA